MFYPTPISKHESENPDKSERSKLNEAVVCNPPPSLTGNKPGKDNSFDDAELVTQRRFGEIPTRRRSSLLRMA